MIIMENGIVLPNYEHCILNTITSILKYYDVNTNHKSLESLDKILEKKYRNVIFLILDGMGEHILGNISPKGYFTQNKIDCVTSVYPSTTTAALTTYYSGKPPYETGWIAWSQYFKEYGRAIDMLPHKESYLKEDISNVRMDVFKNVVNYESVFEQIEKASPNVKAFEVMPKYSDRRANRTFVADDIDEIMVNLETLCEIPGDKFIMAYSDKPDAILHKYGTDSTEAKNYILEAEEKVKALQEKLGDDTIIIVSADHGHRNIEKSYSLLEHPEIMECLYMPMSLESRVVGFWVKENMKKEFEERFNKVCGEDFWLMTKEEFLDKHFLGFGEEHTKVDEFLGNYIALSISSGMIVIETFLAEGKPIKKSTHCGLTKEEMEVPVIVIK